jgi:hypothetical protein
MPCDEELDARISAYLAGRPTARKKMFGGTCHLLGGNILCGVYRDFLILRLGGPQAEKALAEQAVKPFDITGRPMKGWVMVAAAGIEGPALGRWIEKARAFVETLPAKPAA